MIYFIDIEASSLCNGSYPIEIGWISERGVSESHLIRPEPHWTDWDPKSESIHGISREQLAAEGKPAKWVAGRVCEVLPPYMSVGISDATAFDQYWLSRLIDLVRRDDHPRLEELNAFLMTEAGQMADLPQFAGMSAFEIRAAALQCITGAETAERARERVRHRALPDAEGLFWRWREVRSRALGSG